MPDAPGGDVARLLHERDVLLDCLRAARVLIEESGAMRDAPTYERVVRVLARYGDGLEARPDV